LVAGAILPPGKRTVTAALRILGREQENDFPIYHGVLNKAVWPSHAAAGWLLRLLITTFVVVGIDDTIERRWGRKISARGTYRDPVPLFEGHFVKTSGTALVVRATTCQHALGWPQWACRSYRTRTVQTLLCR
jgi:DDE superfamily endonuclease